MAAFPESDRQRLDEIDHESDRLLATIEGLFAHAPLGFAFWDRELRFVRVSEVFARMAGFGRQDPLGRPLHEALPQLGLILEAPLRQAMETGQAVADVELSIAILGDVRYWRASCYPLHTAHGAALGVGAFVIDVTERKMSEAAVVDSEARMRAVLNTVLDGIITISDKAIVESFNPMAERIFGYRAGEVIGQNVSVLMPEPYHSEHDRYVANYLRTGKAKIIGIGREVVGRRKDGSTFPLELAVSEVHVQGHRLFTGVVRDITERKRAEEMLIKQARDLAETVAELEMFAYVASHDLQEPLRMVSSYVQLLARRYQGKLDQDADEFIGYAVDGAKRMQQLINDLLAYSRIGTRGGTPQQVNAEQVLLGTLANLKVAIDESGATVSHDPLPKVFADATQLGQLFQNLIGNALKFRGDEKPHVHISVRDNGDEWVVGVRDNGIGIDPQFSDRIFMVFQRLHSRGEYAGTGIGLAICKKIVERHGGRIWVESRPGQGATFYFTMAKGQ